MECSQCHFRSPDGFRFCGNCGCAFPEPGPDRAPDERLGERRYLTVMFCDLVGSTPLSVQLDPEDLHELIRRYLDAAGAVAKSFSGFIGQYHGDGMLVYFGYPRAREDFAVLGVRAALGIVRAVADLSGQLVREGQPEVQVRIGVHTGLVVVGELGRGARRETSVIVGLAANLAARLQTEAQPGTVVISSDTHRLLRGAFRCLPLGDVALKGIAAPVTVFEVLEEAEAAPAETEEAPAAPLIGRGAELARLREAWTGVLAGAGARRLLAGEAGIGKSRLVAEFRRGLGGGACHWLAMSGAEQAQNSALHPLLALLRQRLGFAREEGAEERLEKIEKFAAEFAFPPETAGALLAAALAVPGAEARGWEALSPAAARQRLIAWLPDLLAAHAVRRPVVLLVEDLHWLDPSTLEALDRLAADAPIPRVLVLCTARPEFRAAWPAESIIGLERLSAADAAGFVESLAGAGALPPELVRQVVSKADGVPLFLEEMVKMALGSGLDAGVAGRELAIPDTLHAVLMAQLDRIAKGREVAQLAAVLGGEFRYEMLRALSPLEDRELIEGLGRLVESGLLARLGAIPDAMFAFRHALIQAEAYQSLLRKKRQQHHEEIARMIEERFPETKTTQPELVAHHFTEAGRPAEALEYWHRAAAQAADRCAGREALAHVGRGLAVLPAVPDSPARFAHEIELTLFRGWALTVLTGFAAPEVAATYARALELCRQLGDAPQVIKVAPVLFGVYIATANFPAAREMADQMRRVGEQENSPLTLLQAWFSTGAHAFYTGDLDAALAAMRRALEFAEGLTCPQWHTLDSKVTALGWGALALLLLGFPDEALRWVRAGRDCAEEVRHPHSIAFARHFVQLVHFWREEPAEALAGMEEYLAFCQEQGFGYWIPPAMMIAAWARGALAPDAAALDALQQGIALWQRTGADIAGPQHFATLAELAGKLGRFDEAFAAIAAGRDFVQRTGEHVYAPWLADLEGALWQQRAPADFPRAEACFREALALARRCGARWHELRAALSLARLLRQLGRSAEARRELAPVAAWFTEGAALRPLREARALLAELG